MADILNIDVNDKALLDVLRPAMEQLENPTPLLERMGGVLEMNVQLRFESQTDPDGVAWPGLAESTKQAYAYKYKDGIPGSLLNRSQPGGRDSLAAQVTDEVLEVGFGEEHMGWHETGTKDGSLPRRGMLLSNWRTGELGAGDRNDLVKEIEDYLAEQLGG